jgi:transposase
MKSLRSKYPPSFKAKVALEAIKEEKSSAELSSQDNNEGQTLTIY